MAQLQKIIPCLWFDKNAEEAAKFYVSVFERSARIIEVTRYTEVGVEVHGNEPGTVMTVLFELDGHQMTALNGGPHFKFNEAISFQIMCDTQQEIDRFWEKLGEGGDPKAQVCGWLKDKFGVSWQIVPSIMQEMMMDADRARAGRVMGAMLKMKKLDIEQLKRAAAGT